MKIWFLILSLVDCIVCPTEKPSIHYSIEDAAMEMGRYKNIKQADLFEFETAVQKTLSRTVETERINVRGIGLVRWHELVKDLRHPLIKTKRFFDRDLCNSFNIPGLKTAS